MHKAVPLKIPLPEHSEAQKLRLALQNMELITKIYTFTDPLSANL